MTCTVSLDFCLLPHTEGKPPGDLNSLAQFYRNNPAKFDSNWMKENKLKLNPDKIKVSVDNGKLDLRIDVFDRITFPMKEQL